MILVAGLARSGLSLTMRMLEAGGYPCVGDYPSFEHYSIGGIPWHECKGKAVKLIDPHRQFPPNDTACRIIRLRRDKFEQAKSFNKFIGMLAGLPKTPEKTLVKSFIADYAVIDKWANKHDVLPLKFEEIINDPIAASGKIASWIKTPMDVRKMAACVVPRSPKCYPTLLELELVQQCGHTL